jgi:hypothetical protein
MVLLLLSPVLLPWVGAMVVIMPQLVMLAVLVAVAPEVAHLLAVLEQLTKGTGAVRVTVEMEILAVAVAVLAQLVQRERL